MKSSRFLRMCAPSTIGLHYPRIDMAKRYLITADHPGSPDRWEEGTNLPHWNGRYIPHSVTFRLHDSVPDDVIATWKRDLQNSDNSQEQKKLYKRIERYSDEGYGECWLREDRIAQCVDDSLLHFDGDRYELHAWVIMPNHVHVLVTVVGDRKLSDVVHSWKSYTAQEANRMLGRSGTFWMSDYHDRYIRNHEHFQNAVKYIEWDPVRADLCDEPEAWRWGSAYHKSNGLF